MDIRKLTEEDVEFIIECQEEFVPVQGNAMVSGDDAVDKEVEDKIINDFNSGNLWAWCTVRVAAKWKEFEGDDYLGCCSYNSEEEFKSDGYFKDMKQNALDELNKNISLTVTNLRELIND